MCERWFGDGDSCVVREEGVEAGCDLRDVQHVLSENGTVGTEESKGNVRVRCGRSEGMRRRSWSGKGRGIEAHACVDAEFE